MTGAALLVAMLPNPASAQAPAANPETSDFDSLQAQIAAERSALKEQRRVLDAQEQRLIELEEALLDKMRAAGVQSAQVAPPDRADTAPPTEGVSSVGVKPVERPPAQEVAVLADRGSVLTKAGRLTIEPTFEYGRADRNRFVFRGIEIPQSVLVGIFDINESRQDVLTVSAVGRFGLTDRIEIGVKVPWVYREDAFVLIPLVQNPPQSGAGTINRSAKGSGIGDVEFLARYQLTDGTGGWPFLTANVQVIAPTGSSPFEVPRDALGNATEAATGFGFWGVSPSVTVLMPTDPATLFGVLGYNFNFGKDVDTRISDAQIDHVDPGSGPNMTAGIGLALNERTSLSFAYAHNWLFSTKSTVRPITVRNGIPTIGDPIVTSTRDLQVGRFLFGISYRVSSRTTINWTVELGATDDATDLRTTLRIPFNLN
ncbi:transporter [Sphingomonas cavernae]|uniref:Transporter n=1 Tax=Sphingomonas cavernae TaxID=2320861 RepID=A0A418WQS7_9SPHN|nr:transporter [Sphingomonas cavernae]